MNAASTTVRTKLDTSPLSDAQRSHSASFRSVFCGKVHRYSTVFLRLRFGARRILANQLHLSLGS
jgi:hypothetical protein